ncbi:MAG: thiamine pyrophosphate-binding protein, partial [Halobacteriales archaeon]|nr:thiamine pyrophosphate-binding protein [Halobacteriales archaeon]
VSIAHGYAKATNDLSLCILHDGVGTLHGAMGLFNAFIDQVPILVLGGGGPRRKSDRRPWIDWIHSNLDQGSLVSDYVKWYDEPVHIDGVAESIARAHRIAMTEPPGPTYVTLDHNVQENPLAEPMEMPDWHRLAPPSGMAPDPASIERAAEMIVDAELPVILADRVGKSPATVDALVSLAEAVGAPVVDNFRSRFNFPNTHPLNLSGTDIHEEADLIVALNVLSLNWYVQETDYVSHESTDTISEDCSIVEIGSGELGAASPVINYFGKRETDLSILADIELAVPALAEAVASRLDGTSNRIEERFEEVRERHDERRASWRQEAEDRWDESPVSPPRAVSEIWEVIKDDEWVLVQGDFINWAHRLWEIEEFDQYVGSKSGGAGVGYGSGAAIGGALAYAESDRVPISLITDGELLA